MKAQCIGTPVSWLALERHALGESEEPGIIREHLSRCQCCNAVMTMILADERRMPALHIAVQPVSTRRKWLWNPRWLYALAPAILLMLVWMTQPWDREQSGYGVKGGDASIELIRERDGQLLEPTHFTPADRFKVQLSCAPGRRVVQVEITQDDQKFYPLPKTITDCGNEVILPGAFSLEGSTARVCVHLEGVADPLCVVLQPED